MKIDTDKDGYADIFRGFYEIYPFRPGGFPGRAPEMAGERLFT